MKLACALIMLFLILKPIKKLTTASTTQVAVSMQTREMQLQTPPCWQSAVKTHPTFVS